MTSALTAIDAERAVLGAMLLDAEAAVTVLAKLPQEAFADTANGRVYAAMRELHDKTRSADLVSVAEHLRANGQLDSVGGASFLSELLGCVATSGYVENHVALVRDAHVRRQIVAAGHKMIREAEAGVDGDELIGMAQNDIFQVAKAKGSSGYVSVADTLGPVIVNLEAMQASGTHVSGVPTGIKKLDRMFLGLQRSKVYVLAARPSMGKSALAANIATNAADSGAGVLLFSLEMSREQLVQRMLATEAGVDGHAMLGGRLSPPEWKWVNDAASRIYERSVYIDDTPGLTYTGLASRARLAATQQEIGLIVVDYLQLMHGSARARGQSKNIEVSEISAGIKELARELDVPVLLLSQLSRGVEYRADKRPLLSDLRDSGSIEQDADAVLFIYRPGQYETDGDDTNGLTELWVRKNRGGPTGMIRLKFNAPTTSFTDWEEGF